MNTPRRHSETLPRVDGKQHGDRDPLYLQGEPDRFRGFSSDMGGATNEGRCKSPVGSCGRRVLPHRPANGSHSA